MTRPDDGIYASMVQRGMSRRTFLKFSAAMAAALALPAAYAPRIAAAVSTAPRIPLIWLRGQACGGDSRALLQASSPTTTELLLDLISVDYQETIMARAGTSAEAARQAVMAAAPHGYLVVLEGAIPSGAGGAYCTIGGRAYEDVAREVTAGALGTIAVGSCAFDGGASAAAGGQTGAGGVERVVSGGGLVSLPGCPVNVANLTATIVHYLTFQTFPPTDARHRPLFAYGGLVHNQCERRAHFEFGEFVQAWGDEGAQKGWCLYKMGCKGPETYANCPTQRYADGTSWNVKAGHGCIGCTMPGFWDSMSPAYDRLPGPIPFIPQVTTDQVGLVVVGGISAAALGHGAASAVRLRRWDRQERRARANVVEAHGEAAHAEAATAEATAARIVEAATNVEGAPSEPPMAEPSAPVEVRPPSLVIAPPAEASAAEPVADGPEQP
ncbi:MAG: hydrogenase small subunit [Candidatus Limnocylindrales bacterium]